MPDVYSEGFGPSAVRYAASLGGIPAVIADPSDPAGALAAAVRRRRAGEVFCSGVLVDDPRALIAREYAAELLRARSDEDGRRQIFDALAAQGLAFNDTPQTTMVTLPEETRKVLLDVMLMGEGLLVRSWQEADRLALLLGRRRDLILRFPGADALVPREGEYGRGDAIVVWAPELPAKHAAIYAFALHDFYLPVIIAMRERPAFSLPNVQYADPGREVLERAAVVLDAEIGGASGAIALAKLGIPLAVTTSSGAAEYLTGVTPYEPWNWRGIAAATQRALAGPKATLRSDFPNPPDICSTLASERAQIPRDGDLVSIIVPTYNRRSMLPRALDSLAAQEYRNVEIIVVNDGGEAISDIVARYPNAVLVENPVNLGVTGATNAGLRVSRGAFIGLLCDDDLFYPDTVSRWYRALSRPGVGAVHGNTVMRFDRRVDGKVHTSGYRLIWKASVDHRDSLYTPFTSVACAMFRREVFERLGEFEDTWVMDIEFLLRVSRAYDFVHVDQPAVEIDYDPDKGQGKRFAVMATQLAEAYVRYPSDSADVAAGRKGVLDWYARSGAQGFFFKPDISLSEHEVREQS